jgi:hypothetical protein
MSASWPIRRRDIRGTPRSRPGAPSNHSRSADSSPSAHRSPRVARPDFIPVRPIILVRSAHRPSRDKAGLGEPAAVRLRPHTLGKRSMRSPSRGFGLWYGRRSDPAAQASKAGSHRLLHACRAAGRVPMSRDAGQDMTWRTGFTNPNPATVTPPSRKGVSTARSARPPPDKLPALRPRARG